MKLRTCLLLLLIFCHAQLGFAAEKPTIRFGVLAFGTSNWELAAMEQQKLLESADFKLEIRKMANPQASKVALQAGAVDVILTDWIWVARMRANKADYTFYPYSSASGALIVPPDSSIQKVADLCNKHLGIAGDELDKNWLLLQALSANSGCDFNKQLQKSFAAAPLLNQQLTSKHVDAVLNYWHYAAQLEGEGYRQILSGAQILQGLGINTAMPNLGYVFKQSWGKQQREALQQFFNLTEQARNQLCSADSAWQAVVPLLKTDNPKTQNLLRQGYCEGRISAWGPEQVQQAEKIYTLLRSVSGDKLTGSAATIPTDTFWFKQ